MIKNFHDKVDRSTLAWIVSFKQSTLKWRVIKIWTIPEYAVYGILNKHFKIARKLDLDDSRFLKLSALQQIYYGSKFTAAIRAPVLGWYNMV